MAEVEQIEHWTSDVQLTDSVPGDTTATTQQLYASRSHVTVFIGQHKLVPAKGGDALKLGR